MSPHSLLSCSCIPHLINEHLCLEPTEKLLSYSGLLVESINTVKKLLHNFPGIVSLSMIQYGEKDHWR